MICFLAILLFLYYLLDFLFLNLLFLFLIFSVYINKNYLSINLNTLKRNFEMSAQFQVQLFTTELTILSIPPESYTFYFHGITKLILQSWKDDYLKSSSPIASYDYFKSSVASSPVNSSFPAHNFPKHPSEKLNSYHQYCPLFDSHGQSNHSSDKDISPSFNLKSSAAGIRNSCESFNISNKDSPNYKSSSLPKKSPLSLDLSPHSPTFHKPPNSQLTIQTANIVNAGNTISSIGTNNNICYGNYDPCEPAPTHHQRQPKPSTSLSDHITKLKQFINISFTPVECSVVCPTQLVSHIFGQALQTHPATILKDQYLAIQVDIAGSNTGSTLLDITAPLSNAQIPIFFIPTHLSDFVLVPVAARENVVRVLKARGFELPDTGKHAAPRRSKSFYDDKDFNDNDKTQYDNEEYYDSDTVSNCTENADCTNFNTSKSISNTSHCNNSFSATPSYSSIVNDLNSNDATLHTLGETPLSPNISQLGSKTAHVFQSYKVKPDIKTHTQLLLTGLRLPSNISNNKSRPRALSRNKLTTQSSSLSPHSPQSSSFFSPSSPPVSNPSTHYPRLSPRSSSKSSTKIVENPRNGVFLKIVQILINPPDFFSVTVVNNQEGEDEQDQKHQHHQQEQIEEVSLIINKDTAKTVFGKDGLKGSIEDVVIPISFDLSMLPENVTGIVAGVAGQLHSYDAQLVNLQSDDQKLPGNGDVKSNGNSNGSTHSSPFIDSSTTNETHHEPLSPFITTPRRQNSFSSSSPSSSSSFPFSSQQDYLHSFPQIQSSYLSTAKSGVLLVSEKDLPFAVSALDAFTSNNKKYDNTTTSTDQELSTQGLTGTSEQFSQANDDHIHQQPMKQATKILHKYNGEPAHVRRHSLNHIDHHSIVHSEVLAFKNVSKFDHNDDHSYANSSFLPGPFPQTSLNANACSSLNNLSFLNRNDSFYYNQNIYDDNKGEHNDNADNDDDNDGAEFFRKEELGAAASMNNYVDDSAFKQMSLETTSFTHKTQKHSKRSKNKIRSNSDGSINSKSDYDYNYNYDYYDSDKHGGLQFDEHELQIQEQEALKIREILKQHDQDNKKRSQQSMKSHSRTKSHPNVRTSNTSSTNSIYSANNPNTINRTNSTNSGSGLNIRISGHSSAQMPSSGLYTRSHSGLSIQANTQPGARDSRDSGASNKSAQTDFDNGNISGSNSNSTSQHQHQSLTKHRKTHSSNSTKKMVKY